MSLDVAFMNSGLVRKVLSCKKTKQARSFSRGLKFEFYHPPHDYPLKPPSRREIKVSLNFRLMDRDDKIFTLLQSFFSANSVHFETFMGVDYDKKIRVSISEDLLKDEVIVSKIILTIVSAYKKNIATNALVFDKNYI